MFQYDHHLYLGCLYFTFFVVNSLVCVYKYLWHWHLHCQFFLLLVLECGMLFHYSCVARVYVHILIITISAENSCQSCLTLEGKISQLENTCNTLWNWNKQVLLLAVHFFSLNLFGLASLQLAIKMSIMIKKYHLNMMNIILPRWTSLWLVVEVKVLQPFGQMLVISNVDLYKLDLMCAYRIFLYWWGFLRD